MSIEIERKFLTVDDRWRSLAKGVLIRQGYLSSHADRIVRVRIEGASAMLTIKGRTVGVSARRMGISDSIGRCREIPQRALRKADHRKKSLSHPVPRHGVGSR